MQTIDEADSRETRPGSGNGPRPRSGGDASSSPRPQLRCYGAGQNFFWQLTGTDDAPRRADSPIRLDWLELMRPSALSSGGHFSYAVSERDGGGLYRWGTDNGRVYKTPTPVALPSAALDIFGSGGRTRRAIAVACGSKHTLILLEGGLVLGCGVGYFGQLGRGDDASSHEPRLIEALSPAKLGGSGATSDSSSNSGNSSSGSSSSGDRVVGIAAGGCHSGCFTKAGDVFMWGFNRSGQCGVGPEKASSSSGQKGNAMTTVPKPRKLEGLLEANNGPDTSAAAANGGGRLKVVQLVCGRHHSACLTDSGAVFCWGATSFGRLGIHDLSAKKSVVPRRVTTLDHFSVSSLASGDFHMLALTRDRRVFSWGYGAEGQCGHGTALHLRTPRPVEALRHVLVAKIACGGWYSAAVSADGYLYTWGYGDGGWLGIGPGSNSNSSKTTATDPTAEPPLTPKGTLAWSPQPLLLNGHPSSAAATPDTSRPLHSSQGPSAAAAANGGGEVCSFDSGHNAFIPQLVAGTGASETQFTHVVCGGSHLLMLAIARPPPTTVTADAASSMHSRAPSNTDAADSASDDLFSTANVRAIAAQTAAARSALAAADAAAAATPPPQQQQRQLPPRPRVPGKGGGKGVGGFPGAGGGGRYAGRGPTPRETPPQIRAYRQHYQQQQQQEQYGESGDQQWTGDYSNAQSWEQAGDQSWGQGEQQSWEESEQQHTSGVDSIMNGGSFGQRPSPYRTTPSASPPGVHASSSHRGTGEDDYNNNNVQEDDDDDDDDDDGLPMDEASKRRRLIFSNVRHGRLDAVEAVLAGGEFDIDEQDENGNTLLFVACQNGLKAAAKLCLKHGSSLDARNKRGNTPLHYCFKYGHNGLGAYLIKKGADDTAVNHQGLTVYEGI